MSILTVRERGDWLVVGFEAEYLTDPAVVGRATRELVEALDAVPLRGNAVLSFEGVVQASSQLAGLLRAARALVVDDRFGRLALCRVGERVGELLRITGLDDSFEVFPRLRDVLAEPANNRQRLVAAGPPARVRGEPDWID